MPFYRCRVCEEDGGLVAEALQVVIEERDGPDAWYGTITTDRRTALQAVQTYQITLEDGWVGTFKVKRNPVAGAADRSVAVQGLGALAPAPA